MYISLLPIHIDFWRRYTALLRRQMALLSRSMSLLRRHIALLSGCVSFLRRYMAHLSRGNLDLCCVSVYTCVFVNTGTCVCV